MDQLFDLDRFDLACACRGGTSRGIRVFIGSNHIVVLCACGFGGRGVAGAVCTIYCRSARGAVYHIFMPLVADGAPVGNGSSDRQRRRAFPHVINNSIGGEVDLKHRCSRIHLADNDNRSRARLARINSGNSLDGKLGSRFFLLVDGQHSFR